MLGEQSQGKPRLDDAKVRYMLHHGINVVPTTSVGRLFDAVACITGVARQNHFEGQAAMLPRNEIGENKMAGNEIHANGIEENVFLNATTEEAYALPGGDWDPLIRSVVADQTAGVAGAPDRSPVPQRAGRLDRGSCSREPGSSR